MAPQPANTQNSSHTIVKKVSWEDYDILVRRLAQFLVNSRRDIKFIHGIERGGLVPAIHLSHLLGRSLAPLIKTGWEKHILVVDDVADSGHTLNAYFDLGYSIATLFYKPQSRVRPHFVGEEVPNNVWIEFPWEV